MGDLQIGLHARTHRGWGGGAGGGGGGGGVLAEKIGIVCTTSYRSGGYHSSYSVTSLVRQWKVHVSDLLICRTGRR